VDFFIYIRYIEHKPFPPESASTSTRMSSSTGTSSGIGSYNPISNLTKQYAQPIGQRLFLFVKTNPNCCLTGGVEALLKQKQRDPYYEQSDVAQESTSAVDVAYDATDGGGAEAGNDPFGFLNASASTPSGSTVTASGSTATGLYTKKSQPHKQMGNFWTKIAKQTTANLEKGITNLAIKADQGKNPDLLLVGLYDSSGTQLWSLSEPQPLPITDYERMKGVSFCIPLTVPALSQSIEHTVLTLKLWIKSGAPLLKQKHYLLGQAHVALAQLRKDARLMSPLTLGLQSSSVVDGQLHLLVCKDLKFPPLYGRGWSLTDASATGYPGLFRLPLDQSYGFNRRGDWWVATERSTESAVVLPVATMLAQLFDQSCQVSLAHATSVAQRLLQSRHDVQAQGNAAAQLQIGYVLLQNTTTGSAASICVSWQRPDAIFEVELIPPSKVPVHTVQIPFSPTFVPTVFYPKVVTDDILPGLLQQHITPPAFLLGNVRLVVTLTSAVATAGDPYAPAAPGSHSQNVLQDEQWEAILNAETYVNRSATADPLQLPLYHVKTGAVMGSLILQFSVTLPVAQAPPMSAVSSLGGLVSLVGLDTLMEGHAAPVLDCEAQPPPSDPQAQRRQQQLKTMGNFVSHQYLQTHISTVRSPDSTMFSQRVELYGKALSFNPQPELVEPCKDRSPKPFRPSSSRSTVELAGIPFNVHTATLALEQGPSREETPGGFFQNVSCGAPADHARGFGPLFQGGPNGGLRRLEAMRLEFHQRFLEAQSNLIQAVASYFVAARQENRILFHIPARNKIISDLRWRVFELMQQLHQITWACAVRRANVFSQTLGISLTSYLTSICSSPDRCETWVKHGYLVTFEGLLSSAGKELGMIEDASVGIAMMKAVSVVLVSSDAPPPKKKVMIVNSPHLKWLSVEASGVGSATQYLVKLGMDAQYYNTRLPVPLRTDVQVRFYPLLYQVGVDIHQAAAHTSMNVKAQINTSISTNVNNINNGFRAELEGDDDDDLDGPADTDVLVALNFEAFRKMNFYAHLVFPVPGATEQLQVHPMLSSLHTHIVGSSGKMNHGILDEAASVAQKLGGGAAVFCKSGKDRTAMHITYKQAQFIHRFLGDDKMLGQQQVFEDATRLRVYGTRLPICEKNVGQAKYAFNTLQVRFMPEMLKPPTHTLAGFLKGGAVFKGGGIES
jgi:hypothetical protein